MQLDARGKDRTGRSTARLGESPEQQAAADFPGGVLNDWQVPLGLLPVAGDIVEILGIGANLLEQGPLRFDVREVVFALIFAGAFFSKPCARQMRSRGR
jgi:hypothetical protein